MQLRQRSTHASGSQLCAVGATASGVAHAQPPTPNPAVDPVHVVITEPVKDSDIPVQLMYVEMLDGVYAPIGLRKPPGNGPFPIVVFASGNGGGGMACGVCGSTGG